MKRSVLFFSFILAASFANAAKLELISSAQISPVGLRYPHVTSLTLLTNGTVAAANLSGDVAVIGTNSKTRFTLNFQSSIEGLETRVTSYNDRLIVGRDKTITVLTNEGVVLQELPIKKGALEGLYPLKNGQLLAISKTGGVCDYCVSSSIFNFYKLKSNGKKIVRAGSVELEGSQFKFTDGAPAELNDGSIIVGVYDTVYSIQNSGKSIRRIVKTKPSTFSYNENTVIKGRVAVNREQTKVMFMDYANRLFIADINTGESNSINTPAIEYQSEGTFSLTSSGTLLNAATYMAAYDFTGKRLSPSTVTRAQFMTSFLPTEFGNIAGAISAEVFDDYTEKGLLVYSDTGERMGALDLGVSVGVEPIRLNPTTIVAGDYKGGVHFIRISK